MMIKVERLYSSFEEEQSIALLTDWLKRHPEDESFRMRRAQMYMVATKFPEAVADYQIGTKSKLESIAYGSQWGLGEAYEKMGKDLEADKAYRAAMPMMEKSPLGLTKLCARARKRGDAKAILLLTDKLIAIDFYEGHLQKAEAFAMLKETQKAIAEYSLLISTMSKRFEHMQTGTKEAYRAAKSLKRALDGRAACYEQLKKHDLAEKDRDAHRRMDRQVFDNTPFRKN